MRLEAFSLLWAALESCSQRKFEQLETNEGIYEIG